MNLFTWIYLQASRHCLQSFYCIAICCPYEEWHVTLNNNNKSVCRSMYFFLSLYVSLSLPYVSLSLSLKPFLLAERAPLNPYCPPRKSSIPFSTRLRSMLFKGAWGDISKSSPNKHTPTQIMFDFCSPSTNKSMKRSITPTCHHQTTSLLCKHLDTNQHPTPDPSQATTPQQPIDFLGALI